MEHDKHCGSYTSRTKHVQQLCRYCCCPSIHTDEPYRRDDRKNPKMIQDLVDARDEDGLKAISQQYVQNTWYKVRFGLNNNLGVHGAWAVHWKCYIGCSWASTNTSGRCFLHRQVIAVRYQPKLIL